MARLAGVGGGVVKALLGLIRLAAAAAAVGVKGVMGMEAAVGVTGVGVKTVGAGALTLLGVVTPGSHIKLSADEDALVSTWGCCADAALSCWGADVGVIVTVLGCCPAD